MEDCVFEDALEEFEEEEFACVDASYKQIYVTDSTRVLYGEFPLHRAAWYNDVELLKVLLKDCSREQLKQLDRHGNSALHVAAMRRCLECSQLLIDATFPCGLKNARGWTPMFEAVESQCMDLALLLYRNEVAQLKAQVKSKRAAMLNTLRELPDCSFQLSWELSSSVPGVGMLVRRYAPHDTYTIHKQGSQIRVDGTLMGIDKDSGMIPEWKRGNFSLLYDTSGESAVVAFLNHKRKTWINLKDAKKRMKTATDTAMELEVLELMTIPKLEAKRIKVAGFKFKPVHGWLHSTVTERVEGWSTTVYEGSGHLQSRTTTKTPYKLPEEMTFEDYMVTSFPEDTVKEKYVSPISDDALTGKKKKRVSDSSGLMPTASLGAADQVPQKVPVNGEEWQKIDGRWHKTSGYWKAAPGLGEDGESNDPSTSPPDTSDMASAEQPTNNNVSAIGLLPELQLPLRTDPENSSSAEMRSSPRCRRVGKAPALPSKKVYPVEQPAGSSQADAGAAAAAAKGMTDKERAASEKHAKKVSGRCWMAKDFPLSLHQLLPLLEVIGTTNKHIAKVAKFMSKYGDLAMFPVKVQIPIMFTVFILLSFKKFKLSSERLEDSYFKVPPDYKLKDIEFVMEGPVKPSHKELDDDDINNDLFYDRD